MPPRWPRKPDRQDPDFRKLDDRMNFAVHVGICATVNSGLWFFPHFEKYSLGMASWGNNWLGRSITAASNLHWCDR
jgi:hypothetical protein